MMGEDVENLQDEEVALDEGNYADDMQDDVDDLQPQEDSLYGGMVEHEAVEDGGLSGGGYYDEDNYNYNYNDSSPLTDVDYRPGNDESSAFTNNYTGTDDYDPIQRDNQDDADDVMGYNDDEDFDGDGDDFDGDDDDEEDDDEEDDEEDDDEDAEEDDEEGEDDEDDDEDEDGQDDEGSEDGKGKKGKGKKQKKGSTKEKEIVVNGVKLWKKGEPITLEVLSTHWDLFREIPEMREMMNQADQVVDQGLNATGPNLILKAYKSVQKIADPNAGAISALLRMVSKPSLTLTYGAAAIAEAIFDQQWMQVTLIFGLKAALGVVLKMDIVKFILEKVFEKGVELYKAKLKKNKNK